MASIFFLKNLPQQKTLLDLRRRYPQLDLSATETNMALLKLASDIIGRIEAQMTRWRLSQGKFCVLIQLNISPDGVAPSELAERLGVTRATITGLVDGLERDGLAKRERPKGDRRSLLVRLTPKGQRRLDGMLPGHFRRTAGLMNGLSENERRSLRGLLAKVETGVPALERA